MTVVLERNPEIAAYRENPVAGAKFLELDVMS
jgi:hypothetical protein